MIIEITFRVHVITHVLSDRNGQTGCPALSSLKFLLEPDWTDKLRHVQAMKEELTRIKITKGTDTVVLTIIPASH